MSQFSGRDEAPGALSQSPQIKRGYLRAMGSDDGGQKQGSDALLWMGLFSDRRCPTRTASHQAGLGGSLKEAFGLAAIRAPSSLIPSP